MVNKSISIIQNQKQLGLRLLIVYNLLVKIRMEYFLVCFNNIIVKFRYDMYIVSDLDNKHNIVLKTR